MGDAKGEDHAAECNDDNCDRLIHNSSFVEISSSLARAYRRLLSDAGLPCLGRGLWGGWSVCVCVYV